MKGFWKKVLPAAVFATAFSAYGCNAGGAKTKMSNYDENGYEIGSKIYSESIASVEIGWHFGDLKIVETDGEISVTESGSLPEKNRVRSKIEDGKLIVKFWQSGLEDKLDTASDKDLVVKIPAGLDEIRVATASANVCAESFSVKTLDIATTSGSAELGKVSAESAKIGSVSGSLRAEEVFARDELEVGSTSGKIKIGKAESPEISIDSISGAVEVSSVSGCGDLGISTTSGEISAGEVRANKAKFESISGKISAELKECDSCELSTTSGGMDLTLGIGAKVSFSSKTGSFHGEGGSTRVYGDGSCQVLAGSVTGSLSVNYTGK